MTTAVAAPPVTAPLAPPSIEQPTAHSSRYAPIAPSNGATPSAKSSRSSPNHGSPTSSNGSAHRQMPESKRSPTSTRNSHAPKIVVKKEPTSPEMPTASRHRPRRLDLSNNNMYAGSGALSARPSGSLTAKDSAGLGMQDVGLACLSPGFHTQDPTMREQLQRSIDVRDRQRQIIEARQKGGKPTNITLDNVDSVRHVDVTVNPFRNAKGPATSRRKGPPPGLSIAPPSAQQFANERVIQSAPLNQSFTGMRGSQFQNLSRQVANQPSNLSQSSHIHHVPANQTNNRLPPISDVFAGESLAAPPREPQRTNTSPGHSSHSNQQQPLPSPSFPPSAPPQQTFAARPREYKSAEEAVQSMSGGREDLLPRIVHYGGHQPPTPPSPMPPRDHKGQTLQAGINPELRSGSSRRRTREEYERDMGTPPLGRQEAKRSGPFGEGRDSPETQRRKKEEFIALCARAWDLFHS
ncbi:uncharacterized protein K452DRAFT_304950 [Aplosporella prunicola CBS 121167]|uniref:Uncharacterized protein n=1 Tax=Aplosporella prunicola CBS 121167 TaxID=1176127 RepID=A0A6A6BR72_9PEZI|nr:uncharacterized protein K452DRAFT_304950 [Aplosporella prunicola CBS 121167]KAF2145943.1 hypothetical protein K452DRAFT_304950 [Aplosporella prunicola CBS 121167]